MELLALALLVSAAIVGWWHWHNHVKRINLDEFGMEAVHRVLKFESTTTCTTILERGWMTNAEWLAMNDRRVKAIEAELRRRDGQGK